MHNTAVSGSTLQSLTCVTCGRVWAPGDIDYTCPDCGPVRGTLEVGYDMDAVRRRLSRETLAADRDSTHWRYRALLPIRDDSPLPPLAVGGTPLYRWDRLAKRHNLDTVWVKDDGRNPSASYKDRASSVALVKALEKGVTTVTAASTGNAASSWAAFTAVTGLKTVIFVPKSAPKAKLAQLLLFGATVIQVEGSYDQAFDLCCEAAARWGWFNRSTAINPYLGEGKKSGAIELSEQLGWEPPDAVFVSVGDGCILQGLWKGFRDAREAGLITRVPRIIGVQAEGSAPLVTAWKAGAETVEPIDAHTVADSISVGMPRDQVKALRAVRESAGAFIAVPDAAILDAIRELARGVGVMAEPAGAAALAGLAPALEAGHVQEGESVAVMVTGNGLKDIDGVMKSVEREPLVVPPRIDAVAEMVTTKM